MKYHSELTEAVNEKKKCSGKLRKLPSSVLVTKFIFVKLFCYPVNLLIKSSANGIFLEVSNFFAEDDTDVFTKAQSHQ